MVAVYYLLHSYMQNIPFIFSEKLFYRLARHLCFWVLMYFGQAGVSVIVPSLFSQLGQNSFSEHFIEPILFLPAQVFFVYSLLYFVIPRHILQSRYKFSIIWTLILMTVAGVIGSLTYAYGWETIRSHYFKGYKGITLAPMPFISLLPFGFVFTVRAVLSVAGFSAAIKLMKYWYEKEYRNMILQREKLDAELQSLKAQLHPHFLFNTLNNIYSITEETSPAATDMLLKLSGLLRYILYECDRPLVPLMMEFKLIEDYIALEKVRYKNLDLHVKLEKNCDGYSISPLLILPLVENCFKHGTSRMLEQPWMKIQADIVSGYLLVKLINGKPVREEMDKFEYGIGLGNVKKRLELLYPGKHELAVISEPDVFIVNLKIQLHKGTWENGGDE